MLPTLTGFPGVTMVLVGGPILTQSSNPALRGVNLEVVGGTTRVTPARVTPRIRELVRISHRYVITASDVMNIP